MISMIALFVAVGGGVALAANIDTDDLKNRAVTNKKIDRNTIKNGRIANETIQGNKIREDTLGQVPSALDAVNAQNAQQAQNAGTVSGASVDTGSLVGVANQAFTTILSLPGAELQVACNAGDIDARVVNTSGANGFLAAYSRDTAAAADENDVDDDSFDPGTDTTLDVTDLDSSLGHVAYVLDNGSTGTIQYKAEEDNGNCFFGATGIGA